MTILPGLAGDAPAAMIRILLGTLPALQTERRLLRQVQPVFPWYQSKRRIKEQANEFLEIDLASVDAELMLRYSHVFYVRRQIVNDSMDKQLTMLDSGKPSKLADPQVLSCLADVNSKIRHVIEEELSLLAECKRTASTPLTEFELSEVEKGAPPPTKRKELDPTSPIEPADYLCMMRVAEDRAVGIEDLESKCKPYLPSERIHAEAKRLAVALIGAGELKADLDKKDIKLLSRLVPPDYTKIGCVEKYRPADVTSHHRFFGERIIKSNETFRKSLWAHIFRKFATHPSYFAAASMNSATFSGMTSSSSSAVLPAHLPIELATAAWAQQQMFPALRLRTHYLYTSADHAKQAWKSDFFVPMMRMFPLVGHSAAEDLMASLLVDGFWAKLKLEPSANVQDESFCLMVRDFVTETAVLREKNLERVLVQVTEALPFVVPVEIKKKIEEKVADEAVPVAPADNGEAP